LSLYYKNETKAISIIKEAIFDINGTSPFAWAYRRMIHTRLNKYHFLKSRSDIYFRCRHKFIATFIRILWHDRDTTKDINSNLFFFSHFFRNLKLFNCRITAKPGIDLIKVIKEKDLVYDLDLFAPTEMFKIPYTAFLTNPFVAQKQAIQIKDESILNFARDKANILSGLSHLIDESDYISNRAIHDVLKFFENLLSKTIIIPYEGKISTSPKHISDKHEKLAFSAFENSIRMAKSVCLNV
jgi:hypothetical protein